jgi:hypothetical protein
VLLYEVAAAHPDDGTVTAPLPLHSSGMEYECCWSIFCVNELEYFHLEFSTQRVQLISSTFSFSELVHGSAVSVAFGCRMDDRGIRVRALVESGSFTSSYLRGHLWSLPSGYRWVLSLGGKSYLGLKLTAHH